MQAIRQVYNDLSGYLPNTKITKHEDIFRNVLKIQVGQYEVEQFGGRLYVNNGKVFVIKKYLVLEKYLIDCILKEKYKSFDKIIEQCYYISIDKEQGESLTNRIGVLLWQW